MISQGSIINRMPNPTIRLIWIDLRWHVMEYLDTEAQREGEGEGDDHQGQEPEDVPTTAHVSPVLGSGVVITCKSHS